MSNPTTKNSSLLFFPGRVTQEIQQPTHSDSEFIIRVDRSNELLPDRMKPVYPNLKPGPSEYHLTSVGMWLHKDQEDGKTPRGHVIYSYLKDRNEFHKHLGYADLLEIRNKGADVFRHFFSTNYTFGWRSVAQYPNGNFGVPYISVVGGQVNLSWWPITFIWYAYNPALVFSK